jgi:2-polyprenyl-6-methoxyphenol hydroxylase-like FAD-dependent oxidoreductase
VRDRSVLICGAGIAGPALAYWLLRYGFTPTLVERTAALRTGGYLIDLWGAGYDLVERMGLLPEVARAGACMNEVRLVNERGRRVGGFDGHALQAVTGGRYTSLPRGELARILFGAIEGRAEALFDTSVSALEPSSDGVLVHFEHGPARRFGVVIGADGLHSTVRRLAFGPDERFERYLGYTVAAFELDAYRPRERNCFVSYARPGRQVARASLCDDRTMFLLVARDAEGPRIAHGDRDAQRRYLRERFADMGWECADIMSRLDTCEDLYFDRVSQVRMERWAEGRVALLGDAAFAPSLLAGQGSALAIIAAYVLAGELTLNDSPGVAFARYEAALRDFITNKQRAAVDLGRTFAPKTRIGILLRNQITRVFSVPFISQLALGSSLRDRIVLPHYAAH